jgi:type VI secretion system protein ImpF
MARRDIERTVQQSVLDRLVDEEPGLAGDPTITWGESVRQLKIALRRDLDWLLNTRRTTMVVPEEYEELRASLFNYGLVDITSVSRDAWETRGRLARAVEEAVRLFEPRLESVRVGLSEEPDGSALRFRYTVEAVLRLDPTPERIVFDTVLDVPRASFEIASTGFTD